MAAKITSIKGLQNLVNLARFEADTQDLRLIDLSNMSLLAHVGVDSNPNLTSINLTGSSQVTFLAAGGCDFSESQLGSIIGFSGLINLTYLYISSGDSGLSGTIDISNLPQLVNVSIENQSSLNSIIISDTQSSIFDVRFTGNALTQTAVNNILIALAANGITGGQVDLRFGTNAAPGAAGLAAKATLEGNGWTVQVNS